MRFTWGKVRRLEAQVTELKTQLGEIQHFWDVLSGVDPIVRTEGNPYPTYTEQVYQLSRMYTGKAIWGSPIAKNVIDVRASFIISEGVKPIANNENVDREMQFINDFLDRNGLDEEAPQDWAKEAEIEGKFLVRLTPNIQDRQIDARVIPWTQHSYTVNSAGDDYAQFDSVVYRVNKTGADVKLNSNQFVFKRFGGRTADVNDAQPKCGNIIWNMESLHKAMLDWRKINRFYASPTPHFKVADKNEADVLQAKLAAVRWKIGMALVTTAEMNLVEMSKADPVRSEITAHAQIVSGSSGVPVHFLGFPELMSNRSTADTFFELIGASTGKERKIWTGFYEELFSKAMAMANENFQYGFNVSAIGAEIPQATATKFAELQNFWLPARVDGEISRETFLSKVPNIDVEDEMEKLSDEQASKDKKLIDSLKSSAAGDMPHMDSRGGDSLPPFQMTPQSEMSIS